MVKTLSQSSSPVDGSHAHVFRNIPVCHMSTLGSQGSDQDHHGPLVICVVPC